MNLIKELMEASVHEGMGKKAYTDKVLAGYKDNPRYAQQVLQAKQASADLRKMLPEFKVKHTGYASVTITPKDGSKFPIVIAQFDDLRTNKIGVRFFKNENELNTNNPSKSSNKIDDESVVTFVKKNMGTMTNEALEENFSHLDPHEWDSGDFEDAISGIEANLQKVKAVLESKSWKTYMQITDRNFDTRAESKSDHAIQSLRETMEAIDELYQDMLDAS